MTTTTCHTCKATFEAQRSTAKYCSNTCRVNMQRNIVKTAKKAKIRDRNKEMRKSYQEVLARKKGGGNFSYDDTNLEKKMAGYQSKTKQLEYRLAVRMNRCKVSLKDLYPRGIPT